MKMKFEKFDDYLNSKGEAYKAKIKLLSELELLGYELKHLREENNLTQKDLAEKLNVSQQQINKLENSNNANIKLSTLEKVVNALGKKLTIGIS